MGRPIKTMPGIEISNGLWCRVLAEHHRGRAPEQRGHAEKQQACDRQNGRDPQK